MCSDCDLTVKVRSALEQGARPKFTGQEKESNGLYYYGARYYDPSLGRFTSADTVLDGLNRYAYCGGNPVNYTDPTGHIFGIDDLVVAAFVSAFASVAVAGVTAIVNGISQLVEIANGQRDHYDPKETQNAMAETTSYVWQIYSNAEQEVAPLDLSFEKMYGTSPDGEASEYHYIGYDSAELAMGGGPNRSNGRGGRSRGSNNTDPAEQAFEEILDTDAREMRDTKLMETNPNLVRGPNGKVVPSWSIDVLNVGNFRLTGTNLRHAFERNSDGTLTRPYLRSPMLIESIMGSGPGRPDPQGVPGARRWDVPGSFRGSNGSWELVVSETNEILHFLFK